MGVMQPFIFGLAFAFIVNLPMVFLENRFLKLAEKRKKPGKKVNRKAIRALSLFLALLILFFAVTLFLVPIIPQLVASVETFVGNITDYIDQLDAFVANLVERFHLDPDIVEGLLPSFDKLVDYVVDLLSGSIPQVVNFTSQITSAVLNVVVGLIVSIYFLYSKETFFGQAKKVLYAIFKRETAGKIIRIAGLSNRTFTGFVSGKIIDSLIIGVLCFVGLTAMKMPYTLLISVIVGVTNVIPFFGPIFGAIPSTLIVLLVDPLKALLLLVFIIALQQFDGNILGPRILGDSTGLPTLWVMFAIIVGGGLFGFVGMLVSVPTFAVIYTLTREGIGARLKAKGLSPLTQDYKSPGAIADVVPEEKPTNEETPNS
ncbi:MAG: AI-2E family transporter [Clostridia bacterium]|nr:AI-2E family transporter [Oscillospiraceae bacterium]MBQ6990538.1 AI-2E family transporter [Clostridia bacterium]